MSVVSRSSSTVIVRGPISYSPAPACRGTWAAWLSSGGVVGGGVPGPQRTDVVVVVEDLDPLGGEAGAVRRDDLAGERAEAGPEVVRRLDDDDVVAGHVDPVEQEDLRVEDLRPS